MNSCCKANYALGSIGYFCRMKLKFIFISFIVSLSAMAQEGRQLCVAFYNQENLFDTIDAPGKDDSEFLPAGKYFWNHEKYMNKISNMSRVISSMNNNHGPDFMGMCEVENDIVLHDLALQLNTHNLNYNYIWFEGPDERGIDNALIYKPSVIRHAKSHHLPVNADSIGGDHTRDILLADFNLLNNTRLVIVVNHWPSRREGETESEYKRIFVARTVKHICDSIIKSDPKCHIMVMGDFNDYPDNRSLSEIMMARPDMSALPARAFYNPMFSMMKAGGGSYRHKGNWNFLDQILLNQNLLDMKSKLHYVANSTAVFKQDWMLETEEKYKGNPKRTFGGTKYLNGFSDHLPVYLYLQMK